jgi:hypothetical protein
MPPVLASCPTPAGPQEGLLRKDSALHTTVSPRCQRERSGRMETSDRRIAGLA